MTDPTLVATAAATVIGALTIAAVTIIKAVSDAKQVLATQTKDMAETLKSLHIQINSRMDELLKSVGDAQHAQGRAEGVESERVRQPDLPKG